MPHAAVLPPRPIVFRSRNRLPYPRTAGRAASRAALPSSPPHRRHQGMRYWSSQSRRSRRASSHFFFGELAGLGVALGDGTAGVTALAGVGGFDDGLVLPKPQSGSRSAMSSRSQSCWSTGGGGGVCVGGRLAHPADPATDNTIAVHTAAHLTATALAPVAPIPCHPFRPAHRMKTSKRKHRSAGNPISPTPALRPFHGSVSLRARTHHPPDTGVRVTADRRRQASVPIAGPPPQDRR